ncbi:phospholipase D-like domain-containing protein, partial [Serratia sp. CY83726]|uniref:phospholipase D-like domain-containing protein n=1 Tax=Serratia sp. CY83726 TaxID=3383691 RepID=UPI003FA17245
SPLCNPHGCWDAFLERGLFQTFLSLAYDFFRILRFPQNKASQAAMNVLVNAGIPVRTVDNFKIMHDKLIITDQVNVETGSFNFSRAAARSNSENALVLRDMPGVAQTYLTHWQSRWDIGKEWRSSY